MKDDRTCLLSEMGGGGKRERAELERNPRFVVRVLCSEERELGAGKGFVGLVLCTRQPSEGFAGRTGGLRSGPPESGATSKRREVEG